MPVFVLDPDRGEARRRGLSAGLGSFISRWEAVFPPTNLELGIDQQRAMYAELCRVLTLPRPAGLTVVDMSVRTDRRRIPVRVYRPRASKVSPALIYAHGGGWVMGGLESHDSITASLAARSGIVVVAVDYRLAPEHPYPAALDDVWAVIGHVSTHPDAYYADPERLMVGGDSAGANLAAAACLRARDGGGPAISKQILIYPELGLWADRGEDALAPSAPLMTRDDLRSYLQLYLNGAKTTCDPLVAPLLNETYGGLPPAYLSVAGHDPLSNDARVYAERLRAAGVPAELHAWPGLVHGFLRARGMCPEADQAFAAICHACAAPV